MAWIFGRRRRRRRLGLLGLILGTGGWARRRGLLEELLADHTDRKGKRRKGGDEGSDREPRCRNF
jgi:hypothetical protein